MADESTKSKKSGRTPEQQAARDARKAARKAAEAEAKATAAAAAAGTDDVEAPSSSKRKRTAEEEADMLEIDLSAGTPLSKAEARAARKRAKKGLEPLPKKSLGEEKEVAGSCGDDDSGKDDKPHADKPKPQARGEYSVWIGNLSFRTTADGLQEFIERGIEESGGERDCITRVNLPKKPGKGGFAESKGFAYVDFKTEALQLLAIGLSERPLDGRRLLIKAGNDHKVNPNARTPKPMPSGPGTVPLGKQMHAESSTLFIGNLPFDVAEEELRDLVEGNADGSVNAAVDGEDEEDEDGDEDAEEKVAAPVSSRSGIKSGLIKTRVAQFEDTGRCKGFAFWDFKSPLHARAALMNRKNHFLRGRRLTLQFASETATKRSGGRRNRPEGEERGSSSGRGGRGGHGGHSKRQPRYFEAQDGDDGEGSYERSGPAQGHTPGDLKSEAAAQARIAALVAGGGSDAHAHTEPSYAAPERPSKDKRGKKWEATGRPRPGAALAMAKRENVGIVESSGSKIVFE